MYIHYQYNNLPLLCSTHQLHNGRAFHSRRRHRYGTGLRRGHGWARRIGESGSAWEFGSDGAAPAGEPRVDPGAADSPTAPPGDPSAGQAKKLIRGKGAVTATPAELAGETRTPLGTVGESMDDGARNSGDESVKVQANYLGERWCNDVLNFVLNIVVLESLIIKASLMLN